MKNNYIINTVSGVVENDGRIGATLDQALQVAGVGWYNIKYCFVLSLFLISGIIEPVGYSYVLPSAKCDLNMSDTQRGFITSIPFIGIVITSFPFGYLVDTQGRKKTVIYSSLVAGIFAILSAFMPNLISFTICKFLTSLCIACPAAVPYTFIGEILPLHYRDVTLSIINAMQIAGAAMVPLLAWAILPLDFRIDFGPYDFRSWRLLAMVNGSFFILSSILLSFGPESPKYLVSRGKYDESMEVLRTIYSKNKGKPAKDYPIKTLRRDEISQKEKPTFLTSLKLQSVPLCKPPFLKWMALNGFLLFGIFAMLNGLYMWLPDVLNRVLTGDGEGFTACEVIIQHLNKTSVDTYTICEDSIDRMTFLINSVAGVCCAVVAVLVSSTVKIIGKKNLLICVLILIGICCILINVVTQKILFAILLSSVLVTALAIGPVNAYAVEIFPTHLRGMAIGLSMMIGRMGSIVGGNIAGVLINNACEYTFYLFGGLLICCGLLALLLPRSKENSKEQTFMNTKL